MAVFILIIAETLNWLVNRSQGGSKQVVQEPLKGRPTTTLTETFIGIMIMGRRARVWWKEGRRLTIQDVVDIVGCSYPAAKYRLQRYDTLKAILRPTGSYQFRKFVLDDGNEYLSTEIAKIAGISTETALKRLKDPRPCSQSFEWVTRPIDTRKARGKDKYERKGREAPLPKACDYSSFLPAPSQLL